jgi:hypothetical protein
VEQCEVKVLLVGIGVDIDLVHKRAATVLRFFDKASREAFLECLNLIRKLLSLTLGLQRSLVIEVYFSLHGLSGFFKALAFCCELLVLSLKTLYESSVRALDSRYPGNFGIVSGDARLKPCFVLFP